MHAFIISSFHYLAINYTLSQNRVHSSKIAFHMSCEHAFFSLFFYFYFIIDVNMHVLIHKIFVLCGKIIITSIYVSFTYLYRTAPPTNFFEIPQP
jgi:hypothetical protein